MGLAYEWGESSWIVTNGEASREPRALITRSDCPGKERSMNVAAVAHMHLRESNLGIVYEGVAQTRRRR